MVLLQEFVLNKRKKTAAIAAVFLYVLINLSFGS